MSPSCDIYLEGCTEWPGAFASKPAPTKSPPIPVGASLLAKNDDAVSLINTTRQLQGHPQTALAQILQTHFTAMTMGNVARNPQAQPIPLLLPSQAKVRLAHLPQPLFGNPRSFIVYMQDEGAVVIVAGQVGALARLQGVV